MIVSTALLVREQGARATSIDDVLQHSGAPRGSVYHHFPGGRDELLREATELARTVVSHRLSKDGDAVAMLDRFIGGYRKDLRANDFRPGCPVVAVAIESDSGLQDLAAETFDEWIALLAERFGDEEIAVMAVAALEGALVLCRAK